MSNIRQKIAALKKSKGPLISVLQGIQETRGYLLADDLEKVSAELDIPISEVYSVVTFYSQFRLKPVGRHIVRVCDGTSCHVCQGRAIVETVRAELKVTNDATTADNMFTLETVTCMGACFLAPVLVVDGDYYGRVTPASVRDIIKRYRS